MLIDDFSGSLDRDAPLFLVTHTERITDLDRCSLNFLEKRYERPNGIEALKPFESLPPLSSNTPYKGSVSVWAFRDRDWSRPEHVATLRPDYKPQHAIWYGGRVWVLGVDRLEVYDSCLERLATVEDPWLADGHTVYHDGKGHLLLSCAGSDAVLFVDESSLKVTRACRMPDGRYGKNYALKRTDSVVDHFITNDNQITHVNAAYPWRGGVVVSTLAQGSIGWFSRWGRYREIVSGFVGCHGVRVDARDGELYFADSTTGTVVFLDGAGRIKERFATRSVWLHDALQLDGDIFALAVADRNVVEIYDVRSKELLGTIDGEPFGQGPQFLYYGR